MLPDPEAAAGAGRPLEWYVAYAQTISPMTPRLFHESAILTLAGTAIARRIRLNMAFGSVYPNIFVLWLAPSTLFHKTVAFNVAREMADLEFPHLLAPEVERRGFLLRPGGTSRQTSTT